MARLAAGVVAVAALAGVILLYVPYVTKPDGTFSTRTIEFFSFFTIETSVFVAVVTGAIAMAADRWGTGRLRTPTFAGAACLYVGVSGITYFFLLRHLYDPEGMELVGTNLLHYVVPPALVVLWLASVPKGELGLRHAAAWLVFPIVYAIYTLVRGALVGWYPYPFVDVGDIGYAGVARSILGFVVAFAAGACVIVAVDRLIGRSRRSD